MCEIQIALNNIIKMIDQFINNIKNDLLYFFQIKLKMNKIISCGFQNSVSLKDNLTLECWGSNQCDFVYKTFECVIDVACGDAHSVELRSVGTIECLGK